MADLSQEDENLFQRFTGLTTTDDNSALITLPHSTTSSVDWSMCLLARVVSNRNAQDSHLLSQMLRAWEADPLTTICVVAKNYFLFEFSDPKDVAKALSKSPWSFRGDLVAVHRVKSHADLFPEFVEIIAIWMHLFNVPLNAFTQDGLILIAGDLGTVLTYPTEGYIGGKLKRLLTFVCFVAGLGMTSRIVMMWHASPFSSKTRHTLPG